jgi:hypothetical protein
LPNYCQHKQLKTNTLALYNQPRYQLAHRVKKELCPRNCEGTKRLATWRRYLDTTTGELLPPEFGICDNRVKCGYSFTPFAGGLYEQAKQLNGYLDRRPAPKPLPPPTKIDLPELLVSQCRTAWNQSNFAQNLYNEPGPLGAAAKDLLPLIAHLYELGAITEGPNAGAAVFVFRDHRKRPRYAQVKQFNATNNGTKVGALHTDPSIKALAERAGSDPWAAVVAEWLPLYDEQEAKQDCLFGAHLLDQYPEAVVCVVEAPKTAIYATLALGPPAATGLLFVATGGAGMLTKRRCWPLRGRTILLIPDADQHDTWTQRGEELKEELLPLGCRLAVCGIARQYADRLGDKNDLADILRHDPTAQIV